MMPRPVTIQSSWLQPSSEVRLHWAGRRSFDARDARMVLGAHIHPTSTLSTFAVSSTNVHLRQTRGSSPDSADNSISAHGNGDNDDRAGRYSCGGEWLAVQTHSE